MKRGWKNGGQVTIFIIVAIIVVAILISLIYVTRGNKLDKEYFSSTEIKPKINDIQSSVINCIDETSEEALAIIGIQGGYYKKPAKYYDLSWAFIPYYYYEGQILMPSKKIIENELGKYINENLNNCLKNLDFGDFKLIYKNPKTSVLIKEKEVDFNTDMPVTVEKEDKRMILELNDYPVFKKSALFDILDIADYYTKTHEQDAAMFCISCVDKKVREKELYFDLVDFKPNSVLVVISENYTSSEPYSFEFLNKYTGAEKSPKVADSADVPSVPSINKI